MTWEIIEGDCIEIMRGMADNSVDLVLTDPPYFKVLNEPWDRQWDKPAEFLGWIGLLCAEWFRLLKPNGSLYVFASPAMAGRVECVIRERFNVLNQIVWNKGEGRKGAAGNGVDVTTLRQFWSSSSERIVFAEHDNADNIAKGEAGYAAKCDDLRGFVFEPLRAYLAGEFAALGWNADRLNEICKTASMAGRHYTARSQWCLPTADHYAKLQSAAGPLHLRREYEDLRREYEDLRREYEDLRREYEDLRRPFTATSDCEWGDVWNFAPPRQRSHPCEKPLPMLRHMINVSSRPGAAVLDCFLGSGATGEAAIAEGRNFVGIEINPEYCRIARERCERVERQPDMFVRPAKPAQGRLL